MKIGILADSHDNIPYLEKAVAFFNREETKLVIHAGDIISPFALKPLEALAGSWVGVTGNNDGDMRGLVQASQGKVHRPPFNLTYHGWKLLVVHYLDSFVNSASYDLIVHGHSHIPGWENINGTLVVNPGECGGWLTGRHTVAIVDKSNDTVRIVDLDEEA